LDVVGSAGIELNQGDRSFVENTSYLSAMTGTPLAVADMNGDGRADVVFSGSLQGGPFRLIYLPRIGALTFGPGVDIGVPPSTGIEVADLDADGRSELLMAGRSTGFVEEVSGQPVNSSRSSDNLTIYSGTASGPVFQGDYGSVQLPLFEPSIGDFDNDGAPDLVFASPTTTPRQFGIHRNLLPGHNFPPETFFTHGVTGSFVPTDSISFAWRGADDLTPLSALQFAFRVDSLTWSAFGAATSTTLTGLSEGRHIIEVTAKDGGGLEDPTPAKLVFTVDLTPPHAAFTAAAHPHTRSTRP